MRLNLLLLIALIVMVTYFFWKGDLLSQEEKPTDIITKTINDSQPKEITNIKKPQSEQTTNGGNSEINLPLTKATESQEPSIPTPDELYEQQQNNTPSSPIGELPPTIPDTEVIPDELKALETNLSSDNTNRIDEFRYEEPLPDDPNNPHQVPSDNIPELPPSEDFEPVVPYELQVLEAAYSTQHDQPQNQLDTTEDILYDNPDTFEMPPDGFLNEKPPVESELNADIE